jgi:tetratricopeptide (TPR) repeat protein
MHKRILTICLIIAATAMFAPTQSWAWVTVRTGQKNFERAWSAYMFRRDERALEYFTKGADAFGASLSEDPQSRTTQFASNLTMAGMSLYYAGRYDQAVPPLEQVMAKDARVWEAPLFSGLSRARQGDKAGAVTFWESYLKTSPSQAIISNEIVRQIAALDAGKTTIDDAASAVERATFDQYDNNITFTGPKADSPQNLCGGSYWWRYSKAPCEKRRSISD